MTDPALEEHVLAIIEAQSKGELQSESIVRRFQESEQVSEQQVAAAHSELHRIVSTHDSLQYFRGATPGYPAIHSLTNVSVQGASSVQQELHRTHDAATRQCIGDD